LVSIIQKVSSIFSGIELQTDIEKHQIDFETATILGTIINELVTNSCKHNSTKDKLTITLTLKRKNDKYEFLYCDDGKGFDSNSVQKGLGLSLIAKFANKLQDAHFNYDSKIKGACFKLSFTPNPKSTHSQSE
jgi:two-component sensor histidine kinase